MRHRIDEKLRQGHAVLLAPALSPYWSDERLAEVGVTRQQVVGFFDQYRREGPLFSYREVRTGETRQVYRLVSAVN